MMKPVTKTQPTSDDLAEAIAGAMRGMHDLREENAALRAHKYLCGPWFWLNRPDFKCFQGHGGDQLTAPGPGLQAAFVDAEKKEFGPLWNTPGRVTGGPFASDHASKPPGK